MRNLVLLLVVASPSCRRQKTIDDVYAEQAVDSADVSSNEAAILYASVDVTTPEMSAEEAATAAWTNAGVYWQPAGCIVASQDGATVTYEVTDCTGPFGLVHVSGMVVVVYSVAADGLHAVATADALDVNGGSMDVDAEGILSFDGSTRVLDVTTHGEGVGPRGTAFTRDGDYTVSWDPDTECFGLDGSWSTTIGLRRWSTDVSAFDKCGEGCPAAGGHVSYHGGLSGVTVDVDFDGSSTAAWESSRGSSGTIDLFCTL
jgi:hypothetical protein